MFISTMPNLVTADIRRSVAFYRDQLGLTQKYQYPRDGEPEHVELRIGDSKVALSTHRAMRKVGLPEPTGGNTFELVMWCEDVDSEVARLRAAGVSVLVEPYDHIASHRRASVADPDGNWVTLVAEPG
jgi:lactoylglutathione lyase